MEYSAKNDFYIKFKGLFNEKRKFIDYMLVDTSTNFNYATGLKAEALIGERISRLITENEYLFGLEELYINLIPYANRRYELYIETIGRWYMISIFADEVQNLILVYTDITDIKNKIKTEEWVYDNSKKARIHYRDSLTQLYTRGFFYEEINRLNTERQLPISVIMGDVNSLKLVNDAFGHEMGDRLLMRVAEGMKKSFRKEDIISRIGGDEFAILLPNTDEEQALNLIDRLKKEYKNNPLDYITISVSFGVATKTRKEEDISDIIRTADKRMYYMKIKENKQSKEELISYMKRRLETITLESKEQNERLIELCMIMAEKFDLSNSSKEELRLLAEYHDIGHIGISTDILYKEGNLNSNEWEDIKRHSEIGYHILKGIKDNTSVNDLILIHHERWDGEGYPGFLKGEDIPIEVRIFSVVDAYESMINHRPYREKMSKQEAIKELQNGSGTQFDPEVVQVFVETINRPTLGKVQ